MSTLRAIGDRRESSRTAGRHHRPSDASVSRPGDLAVLRALGPSPSRLGELVKPVGPRTRARVARGFWWTPWDLETELESPGRAGGPRGTSDNSPSSPGHLVDPTGPRTPAQVATRAGRQCGPADMGPCRPGELVDPAEPQTFSRVARDCLSTPQALGHWPVLPGTAGLPRRLWSRA